MDKKQGKTVSVPGVRAVFPIGKRLWKSRPIASMLLGVALLLGGQTQAHQGEHNIDQPMVGKTEISELMWQASSHPNLPFVDLGVVDSREGESKNEYMLRVGQILDRFTVASGHEGCGIIMENKAGDAWRVRLITNRSQVACVSMLFDEPGYHLTDETIHSHPQPRGGIVYANFQDQTLRGFDCGRRLAIDDADFSPGDLENGPGYLVARGKLLHHRDGKKTLIGKLPETQRIEGLAYIPNDTGRMSAPRSQRTLISSKVQADYHPAWGKGDTEGLPTISCRAGNAGRR